MRSSIEIALGVIDDEINALEGLKQYINESFSKACEIILQCKGKVIVTGMGKSGHIGSKIAATMASTGTPSFFVHPGEASHGDLGMISENDVVIAISNSGETKEVLAILPILQRRGITIIGMSGSNESTLAKYSTVHLCFKVEKEACPLNLAPTSSTTATLVLGDALAVALLELKGFTANDFALSHPGGALGKRLLTRNCDIMHTGEDLPIINSDTTLKDAIFEMTSKGLGMVVVKNQDGTLYGVFTDGDLRRVIDKSLSFDSKIDSVVKKGCITVEPEKLVANSIRIMKDKKINGLVIVDKDNMPIGVFNMHDLLEHGMI
ncbi:MAG: KpsF/GutQ family sugar-phosphate isomerase [Succinivibrionaceae bacterium]|nr:KpsF/GutQ family sugar-phosphate isomerase [Ruminobacter sp.]MDY5778446.1 KpsF/GutQ family sugar-phosphate isomerase [Succinivibrionaceae bacterium]MEE1339472.1 KpsF/GutQ family sugar-phosphate isomerase [Succinivibrionaceae bacterium]